MKAPVVLAYHGIGYCPRSEDPNNLMLSPELFEEQMHHLVRRHHVVPLEKVLTEGSSARATVAITFDDAYVGVLTYAAPVLHDLGLPGTIFLPTASIGGANSWDPAGRCDLAIMDEEQCRAVSAMGLSIESHGHDHIDMSAAPAEDVHRDLKTSIDAIAALTGRAPRFLAYPFGRHSPTARAMAAECGFEAAFSIDAPGAGPYARPRLQVTRLDGRYLFRAKASGIYGALRWSPLPAAGYRFVRPVARRFLERKGRP